MFCSKTCEKKKGNQNRQQTKKNTVFRPVGEKAYVRIQLKFKQGLDWRLQCLAVDEVMKTKIDVD